MGTTSAGSIQLDLEVKTDLDDDIQSEASKLADRIRKQVDSMSGDMFKNLRQSIVASLDKMTETVKSCLDRTKAEMQAFVEQMGVMIKKMSGVQMPFNQAEDDSKPQTTQTKTNPMRGPPSISIRKPKMNFDIDTSTSRTQMDALQQKINETTARIQQQKMKLQAYVDELENVSDIKNSFSVIRNEITQNENKITHLNEQIAKFKSMILSTTSMSQKIAYTNEIKVLDNEIVKARGDIEYLQQKMGELEKVDTGKAITSLTDKIGRLKASVDKGNISISQMKSLYSELSENSLPIKIPEFPQLAMPLSATGNYISMADKVTSRLAIMSKVIKPVINGLKKLGNAMLSGAKKGSAFVARLLGIGSASHKASSGMGKASMGIGRLIKSFTIFSLIFPLVSRGVMALGQNLGATLMTNTAFASSLNQIRSNLATAFTPIFQAILPALNALMASLAKITGYISAFIAGIFGQTYSSAKQATAGIYAAKDAMGAYGSTADKAAKANEKVKRSLMGFDEINKLDEKEDTSGSSGGGSGAPVYTPTDVDEGIVNSWVKKLKDLWKKGDYAGIGKLIGEQINKAVTSFTKWISWDSVGASITAFTTGFSEMFNSLISTINWENIGKLLGTGINTIARTIRQLLEGIDWQNIGKAFADGLNGLVYTVDWDNLGATIGAYFQARIDALYGFVTNADWAGIGKALAKGVTSLGSSINWNKLGELLGKGLSGAVSSIHNFISNIDWRETGWTIGTSINNFFANVNWADLGATLSGAARGLLNTLRTAISSIDWFSIGKAIADYLCNIDWLGLLIDVAVLIGRAFVGLTATIITFVSELASNIVTGFFNGIMEFFGDPIGWIKSHIVDPFINAIKDLFGIHSPSTVMLEIGGNLIQGLINGIGGLVGTLVSSVAGWFGGIADTIGGVWNGIKSAASTAWDGITSTISDAWEGLKTGASETWENIKSGISSTWEDIKTNASSTWDNITSSIGEKWDSLKKGASDTWENLKSSASSTWDNIKTAASDKWSDIKSGIGGLVDGIKTNVSNGFNGAKSVASTLTSGLKTNVLNTFNNMSSNLAQLPGKLRNNGYDMFSSMRNGVNSTIGSVQSAISNGMDNATAKVRSLSGSASGWGSDMMSGLANGIRNASSWVTNAVSNVASTISSWLHFTRPDVGPLREYETWMPDMMQGLSSTLELSTPTFINRVKSLAESMSYAMQTSLDEPTIAFAGERNLSVQHEWKEDTQKDETVTASDIVGAIENLNQKFDEIKEEIKNKDTNVYLDDEKVTKKVVDNVNEDTRKNGKCPIDM